MNIATLILAAGASTRLGGEPKQLITNNGVTLVRHITSVALSLRSGPVVVVVGANRERILPELTDLPIQLVYNPDWPSGMASSLRAGLTALPVGSAEAFLVLLTDQPFVTAGLLQQLLEARRKTGAGIIASQYGADGFFGVPALFDIRYQPEFVALDGDVGARKLIKQHAGDCVAVSFPLATVDLDTQQDVENWQSTRSSLPLPQKWPDS